LIPLDKVRANMTSCPPDKEPVVLVSTGAYAPVHKMHFVLFDVAKSWLETHYDFVVVGGFMSPSHDDYVAKKMRKNGVPHIRAADRLKMCKLAVRDSSWVDLSRWEASLNYFADFPEVAVHHHRYITAAFRARTVKVMYLCGADHARNCDLYHGLGVVPVVAVARPGSSCKAGTDPTKFILVETETEDVSSTQVRKCLQKGEGIEELVGPAVAEYIFKNRIDALFKRK